MPAITIEYKRSEEYKEWFRTIKADHPNMPEYLIDMAIAYHKANPRAYRDWKLNSKYASEPPPRKRQHFTVEDAVKVYDAGDAPKAEPVRVVEA